MLFDLSKTPIPEIEELLSDIWDHAIEQDRFIAELQARQTINLTVSPSVDESILRLTKRLTTTEREVNSLRSRISQRSK